MAATTARLARAVWSASMSTRANNDGPCQSAGQMARRSSTTSRSSVPSSTWSAGIADRHGRDPVVRRVRRRRRRVPRRDRRSGTGRGRVHRRRRRGPGRIDRRGALATATERHRGDDARRGTAVGPRRFRAEHTDHGARANHGQDASDAVGVASEAVSFGIGTPPTQADGLEVSTASGGSGQAIKVSVSRDDSIVWEDTVPGFVAALVAGPAEPIVVVLDQTGGTGELAGSANTVLTAYTATSGNQPAHALPGTPHLIAQISNNVIAVPVGTDVHAINLVRPEPRTGSPSCRTPARVEATTRRERSGSSTPDHPEPPWQSGGPSNRTGTDQPHTQRARYPRPATKGHSPEQFRQDERYACDCPRPPSVIRVTSGSDDGARRVAERVRGR